LVTPPKKKLKKMGYFFIFAELIANYNFKPKKKQQ